LEPNVKAEDFVTPGHVFPLIANAAGVLGRQGQTEGSYDLARISGFEASAVICEILSPDGTMARGEELNRFARQHNLRVTTVEQVIRHRVQDEVLLREVARAKLNTDYGEFTAVVFEDDVDGKEHLALMCGAVGAERAGRAPLVRIHSECLTGDVFGSQRCDCRAQLDLALKQVVAEGGGAVLYLRQEGRGIGLANKLRAYALQDLGHDTVEANLRLGFPADVRDFAVAAKMLTALGVSKIKLLTNNPRKIEGLSGLGIEITERVPVVVEPTEHSRRYLSTKRDKLGHFL
jgi:3,4-dihydroxy 2-butanone 4-phosphate synthase / GTP cyclohydrolase II